MKNNLPLTRVTAGTRESIELQSHKWKDNSVNHCPNSLPNSPRKCNPDLLVRGTFFMVTGGQMTVTALGSRAAVSTLQLEPAAPAGLCQPWVRAANAGHGAGADLHSASRDSGAWNIFSCWGICTGEHKPTHTLPQLPQSKATLEWSFYPNYLTKCIQFILLK